VPVGSNNPSQTTECPTPESCYQTPSNMATPSTPPVYPSVDIDAHVSRFYQFILRVLIYYQREIVIVHL
jgi:hypothetical protein